MYHDLHDARMGNHSWTLVSLEPAEPGTIGVFAEPYRTKVRNLIHTEKVIGWALWKNERGKHRRDGMYFGLKNLGATDEPPCPEIGLPDFFDTFNGMDVFEEDRYFLDYAKDGDDLSIFYPAAREIQAQWFEERLNQAAQNIFLQAEYEGWSEEYALNLLERERRSMLRKQREVDKERSNRGKQRKIRQTQVTKVDREKARAEALTRREEARSKRREIPLKLRFAVLTRDKFTCQYCGRQAPNVALQIDHIIAFYKGGLTTMENLTTACTDCNLGKSNHPIPEFTSTTQLSSE